MSLFRGRGLKCGLLLSCSGGGSLLLSKQLLLLLSVSSLLRGKLFRRGSLSRRRRRLLIKLGKRIGGIFFHRPTVSFSRALSVLAVFLNELGKHHFALVDANRGSLGEERVLQHLFRGRPLARIPDQTLRNKVPEVGREILGLGETNVGGRDHVERAHRVDVGQGWVLFSDFDGGDTDGPYVEFAVVGSRNRGRRVRVAGDGFRRHPVTERASDDERQRVERSQVNSRLSKLSQQVENQNRHRQRQNEPNTQRRTLKTHGVPINVLARPFAVVSFADTPKSPNRHPPSSVKKIFPPLISL